MHLKQRLGILVCRGISTSEVSSTVSLALVCFPDLDLGNEKMYRELRSQGSNVSRWWIDQSKGK